MFSPQDWEEHKDFHFLLFLFSVTIKILVTIIWHKKGHKNWKERHKAIFQQKIQNNLKLLE